MRLLQPTMKDIRVTTDKLDIEITDLPHTLRGKATVKPTFCLYDLQLRANRVARFISYILPVNEDGVHCMTNNAGFFLQSNLSDQPQQIAQTGHTSHNLLSVVVQYCT